MIPSLALIAWALGAGAVVILNVENPYRSVLVLPFLCVAPGLAAVPLLRLTGWTALTLAVGLSLALDALVPTAMIYSGVWSPDATLAILVAVTIAGATSQLGAKLLGSRPAVEAVL